MQDIKFLPVHPFLCLVLSTKHLTNQKADGRMGTLMPTGPSTTPCVIYERLATEGMAENVRRALRFALAIYSQKCFRRWLWHSLVHSYYWLTTTYFPAVLINGADVDSSFPGWDSVFTIHTTDL